LQEDPAFADLQIELIRSSGGVFEVVADGHEVFSKKKSGRFPEHQEIVTRLSELRRNDG
jgi:selenoprotein W-related protein